MRIRTVRSIALASLLSVGLVAWSGCNTENPDGTPNNLGKAEEKARELEKKAAEGAKNLEHKAVEGAKNLEHKVVEGAKEAGDKIKEGAKEAGDKIKEEAQAAKDAASKGLEKLEGKKKD
jgi:hypothetical protein